jgi:hypothetical protein
LNTSFSSRLRSSFSSKLIHQINWINIFSTITSKSWFA